MTAGEGVPPLVADARTPAAGHGNGDGGSIAARPAPAPPGRTALGLTEWGRANRRLVLNGGSADVGCGIGRGGEVRYEGRVLPLEPECQRWAERVVEELGNARDRYGRVDFAVVETGPWDVADRKLEGDDRWRSIGDPTYDAYLRSELDAVNELLVGQGATAVWLTAPHVDVGQDMQPPPPEPFPESDPARMDALNDMIRTLAATREGVVVVDLAGQLAGLPAGEDEHLRPDGVHFTPETALEVADDWLGEELHSATTREPGPAATRGSTGGA